jgi:carboxymethylenebutenolidase
MGGCLAFLTSARTDTDAGACYYGGGTHTGLGEVPKIKKPVLQQFSGIDDYMPPTAQDQIKDAVKSNPNITVYVYSGTARGFCRSTDPRNYDAAACLLAYSRRLDLFKSALA